MLAKNFQDTALRIVKGVLHKNQYDSPLYGGGETGRLSPEVTQQVSPGITPFPTLSIVLPFPFPSFSVSVTPFLHLSPIPSTSCL